MTKKSTLVLGIGNTLLTDEGAGVHALEYLRRRYPGLPGVHYLDGGTLSFTLAGEIEDADNLIVIDAAQLDAAPGEVRCLTGTEMDRFLGKGKCSVHEVGLADLMDIARLTGTFPQQRALIGIQPGTFGWGDAPSAPVGEAFPQVAVHFSRLIRQWSGLDDELDEILDADQSSQSVTAI